MHDLTSFSLATPPPGFVDDPAPWWAALRERSPVHPIAPHTVLLRRYADMRAVYRSADVGAVKKREFGPKFGVGKPLYEHHTTSQVFSDPPRHTRLRRNLMGALNQRAIARMEAGVHTLVDRLVQRIEGEAAPNFTDHFAAQIPVEVGRIEVFLDVPVGIGRQTAVTSLGWANGGGA